MWYTQEECIVKMKAEVKQLQAKECQRLLEKYQKKIKRDRKIVL